MSSEEVKEIILTAVLDVNVKNLQLYAALCALLMWLERGREREPLDDNLHIDCIADVLWFDNFSSLGDQCSESFFRFLMYTVRGP